MSEKDTVVIEVDEDGSKWQLVPDGSRKRVYGTTDWERLENMTEEEIEANALSDPDNPPMTEEELARMMRVPHAKAIRERLGLTQEEFAHRFHIPLQTIQTWEQGPYWLDWTGMLLLRVIDTHPEAVLDAFARYGDETLALEQNDTTPPATRRYRAAG